MSKMKDYSKFEPGTILVHELDDALTFHSGDEFSRLIFVTSGSTESSYRDFEYGDMQEVVESNAVDVFAGDLIGWGMHMFLPIDDFEEWISNMKFLLEAEPNLRKKIEMDGDDEFSSIDRFRKRRGLQITNAIIRHANLILMGIENGKFVIPRNVKKTYRLIAAYRKQQKIDELREEVSDKTHDLHYNEVDTDKASLLSEEIASLKDQIESLKTTTISDDDVNQLIDNELIPALRRIAAIEPFSFIDTMVEEEIRHYQKYLKKKEREKAEKELAAAATTAESKSESCEEEDSYEESDPYEEDDRCESISDAIEEAEEDLPQSPYGPGYPGPDEAC